MASRISEVLEILTDGRWHMLSEIKERTRLSECQIKKIVTFLKEYKFVATDDKDKEVKLEPVIWDFLREETTS